MKVEVGDDVEYNVYLKGGLISHKTGVNYQEKLSQELDTGSLVIPSVTFTDINQFDEITIISIEDIPVTKNMLVADVEENILIFEDEQEFNYLIGLVSPTIKLQRIILPNRMITYPLTGALPRMIDVIEQYIEVYAPKYTLSTHFISVVSNTIAPEQSWNEPNLFEVINDLLTVVNCVVTMDEFEVISLMELDTKGDAIDETKLNNLKTFKNIAESVSALEMTASNVIGKKRNATTGGWVGLRTVVDAFLTVENAVLKLANPIYSVEKLIVIQQPAVSAGTRLLMDISTQVLEKKVWDSKLPSNLEGDIYDHEGGRDYKRNFIWFKEGSNLIEGMGFRESNWVPLNANSTSLQYAVNRAFIQDVNLGETAGVFDDIYDFGNCLFYCEYTTIDNVKYRAYKTKGVTYESILVDNQENVYVDSLSLGNKQQQKVDAIGNKKTICFGKYPSINDVPKLGDRYKDVHILTERTIVINDEFIQFSGILTENYVGKNKFTGINSIKRYTAYATESDSTLSNHITNVDLQFDFIDRSSPYTDIENYLIDFGKEIGRAHV